MHVRISDQLALFLASFVCGCVLSVFYDIIRMSRMSAGVSYGGLDLPKREDMRPPLLSQRVPKARSLLKERTLDAFVFFGDVLFFAIAAFAMLCVFFNYGGKVRGLAIFIAVIGFLCCHFTVGAVVMRVFGIIMLLLGLLWEYAVFFLLLPIKRIVIPIFKRVSGCVMRVVRLAYLRGYTKRTEKRLLYGLCGLREHGRGR